VHRRDPLDRGAAFPDGPDRALDVCDECGRITGRANDERLHVVDPGPLPHRDVESVGFANRERRLLHVSDDADDDVPWAFGVSDFWTEPKPLTDGISIAELASRVRFVDQNRL